MGVEDIDAFETLLFGSFLVTSFRILSILDLPSILRSQLISATFFVLFSGTSTRTCNVILFDLHILFIVPNIVVGSPILRFVSFVQRQASVITPPNWNSVTCSSVYASILFISTVFCCFPIVIVFVFSTLILSPNLSLLLCTSSACLPQPDQCHPRH